MKEVSIQLDDLSANMQDYLEAVSVLKNKNGKVRVRDLSDQLKVRRSSVTEALGVLSQKGLVIHERYGTVDVTPQGEVLAEKVYQRHQTLTRFIQEILGVDGEIASKDACRVEHAISPETFDRLYKFVEFLDKRSVNHKPKWLSQFRSYCKTGKMTRCQRKK